MRAPLALAMLAMATLAVPIPAAADTPSARPATLTVSGQGSMTRSPDRVVVSFRVESVDAQAARATAANTTMTNALHDALVRLGIAASAIVTASYGISYNPRPPQPEPSQAQRYGYIVERIVNVTVDRTDMAGAIVDAGVGAGVTGVNGVTFELRDPRAAFRAAQADALADAQSQARALAAGAHVRLVRILDVAPAGGAPQPVPLARMAIAAAPTQIEPGNLTAHATVTLRFEISPAP